MARRLLELGAGYRIGSPGTTWLIAVFCALLLLQGIGHYRGRHTWVMRFLISDASFFAVAWYGAAGLLTVLDSALSRFAPVLALVLFVPTAITWGIAIMALFWLPARLLPAWYLEWRAHGRPAAELRS